MIDLSKTRTHEAIYGAAGLLIPDHIKEGIIRYVECGILPGRALQAVLSNDLFGALGRLDHHCRPAIEHICKFIYNEVPSTCWGSPEKMQAWSDQGGTLKLSAAL